MDFRGIAEDFRTLRQFSLPEAHSGGMAAVVQGLGVVSLLGVAACGGLWFFLNELFGGRLENESMVTPVFATPILTTSWLA